MDDLRQRLVALSERSDDALAFERLRAVRARRVRSRRVGAAVLAAVVAVAGIGLAISAFSDDHATPAANGTITWHRYTDPLGWSIEVPDGWSTAPIDASNRRGAEFASFRFPPHGPEGWWSTPDGEVSLVLVTTAVGHPGRDDSAFPLRSRDAVRIDGGRMLLFQADGGSYDLRVLFMTRLSPRHRAIVDRMVSSISFPPGAIEATRVGAFAFSLHRERPRAWRLAGVDWIDLPTGVFAYFAGPSDGALVGPIPACGSMDGMRSATVRPRGALLRCPGGDTRGWTADGEPFASNATRFAYPLAVFPVIRSWDGVLLTSAGVG